MANGISPILTGMTSVATDTPSTNASDSVEQGRGFLMLMQFMMSTVDQSDSSATESSLQPIEFCQQKDNLELGDSEENLELMDSEGNVVQVASEPSSEPVSSEEKVESMRSEMDMEIVSSEDDKVLVNVNEGGEDTGSDDSKAKEQIGLLFNWMAYENSRVSASESLPDGETIEITGNRSDISSTSLQPAIPDVVKSVSPKPSHQETETVMDNEDDLLAEEFDSRASNLETGQQKLSKQETMNQLMSQFSSKHSTVEGMAKLPEFVTDTQFNASNTTNNHIQMLEQASSALNTTQTSSKSFILPTPVTHQDWSNQFNQQIVWLSQQQVKSAVIRLTPKEMGEVEMHLKIDKNQATLQMTTQHEGSKDIIEQSMPRLREMMHQQGIQLEDVNVQTRQQQEQQSSQRWDGDTVMQSNQLTDIQEDEAKAVELKVSKGLVDYFA